MVDMGTPSFYKSLTQVPWKYSVHPLASLPFLITVIKEEKTTGNVGTIYPGKVP